MTQTVKQSSSLSAEQWQQVIDQQQSQWHEPKGILQHS